VSASSVSKWRRLSAELRDYLATPITAETATDTLRTAVARRAQRFLAVLRDHVYAVPDSPYLALLRAARITFDRVASMIERDGVEATLGRLAAEGVWVSVDEFKGRRPIRRGSFEVTVGPTSFDPPGAAVGFQVLSGRTRSSGTPSSVNFPLLAEEALHLKLLLSRSDADRRALMVWRPILPSSAGTKFVLRFAKIDRPPDRWWSHTPPTLWSRDRGRWRTHLIVRLARFHGAPVPYPEHVPIGDAMRVVRWARERPRRDVGAVICTYASSAVRVCGAARAAGASLEGVHFLTGGESLTADRAALIREVGATVSPTFGLAEAGSVAVGCTDPEVPDDMHPLLNRVALVQVPRSADGKMRLLLTTLSPYSPKVLLNLETGDAGTLTVRPCGCPLGRLGFTAHLSNVISYEKLTAEGMTFLASDIARIVEQLLPRAFGGVPTDYQFVQDVAADGLSRLSLRVSPRLGAVDEGRVLAVVREELQRRSPHGAHVWNDAGVVGVVRAEPVSTVQGKLFPLHVANAEHQRRDREPA
jgi:hypothetical protein